jgi:hypothetical protein
MEWQINTKIEFAGLCKERVRITMPKISESWKDNAKKSREIERKLERPFEKFSRFLWPWAESKLILFVSLLAVLDYVSTFAALELSGNNQISEAGLLAKWALETGGFLKLFLVDAGAIGTILFLAIGVRALYRKWGFPGFGRTGFVFLLIPYAVIIMGIVINNIILTFI